MTSISAEPRAKAAWHPCSRRISGSPDAAEILSELSEDVSVAWLTGSCDPVTTAFHKHRLQHGPLPTHRQPPGDLLNYDALLVAAAATGADALASDVIPKAKSTAELAAALYACEEEKRRSRPLFGLVLAGGESRRMGSAKADLEVIPGHPQALRATKLLDTVCAKTYLSVRADQDLAILANWDRERWPILTDELSKAGPMAGIITALRRHPDAAWLVVACDLPYLTEDALKALLAGRRPLRYATGFRSVHDGFPEPLCTVYEPKSLSRLLQFLASGCRCPRRVLNNSRIALVEPDQDSWMENMNHPQEFEAARGSLA